MMGENIAPKHVEPTLNNKLIYIVHLVGYFHSCITMHGFMKVKKFNDMFIKKIIIIIKLYYLVLWLVDVL